MDNVGRGLVSRRKTAPSKILCHCEAPKVPHPRVASLAPLGQFTFWQSREIPTTSLRTGLGMTCSFGGVPTVPTAVSRQRFLGKCIAILREMGYNEIIENKRKGVIL